MIGRSAACCWSDVTAGENCQEEDAFSQKLDSLKPERVNIRSTGRMRTSRAGFIK